MCSYITAGGCERDEGGTFRDSDILWLWGKSKGELVGIITIKESNDVY
jgi:hypothetical protein